MNGASVASPILGGDWRFEDAAKPGPVGFIHSLVDKASDDQGIVCPLIDFGDFLFFKSDNYGGRAARKDSAAVGVYQNGITFSALKHFLNERPEGLFVAKIVNRQCFSRDHFGSIYCGLLAGIFKSECYFGILIDCGFEIFRGNQASRSNPSSALELQGLVGFLERAPLQAQDSNRKEPNKYETLSPVSKRPSILRQQSVVFGFIGIGLLCLGYGMLSVWVSSSLRSDWLGYWWVRWGAFLAAVIAVVLGVHCLSMLRLPSAPAISSLAHLTSLNRSSKNVVSTSTIPLSRVG